jgi:hypothetical protein
LISFGFRAARPGHLLPVTIRFRKGLLAASPGHQYYQQIRLPVASRRASVKSRGFALRRTAKRALAPNHGRRDKNPGVAIMAAGSSHGQH